MKTDYNVSKKHCKSSTHINRIILFLGLAWFRHSDLVDHAVTSQQEGPRTES